MRLQDQLMKDLLVTAEGLPYEKNVSIAELLDMPIYEKYNSAELLYHIEQLGQAGLITYQPDEEQITRYTLDDLTPKGHVFLARLDGRENIFSTLY